MVKVQFDETKQHDKIPAVRAMKRPTKKKAKDKPKRPLSAYNFFFKDERERIRKLILADGTGEDVGNNPDSDDYINPEQMAKLKEVGGKVSFPEMGKLIGSRWKTIASERLNKFTELAAQDSERYKKEMQAYHGKQEAKMRSEAQSAPVNFGYQLPLSHVPEAAHKEELPVVGPMAYPDGQGSGVPVNGGGYPPSAYGPGPGGYMGGYNPYGMNVPGYGAPMPMPGYYGDMGPGTGGGGADVQVSYAQSGYAQSGGYAQNGVGPGMYGGGYQGMSYGASSEYGAPQGSATPNAPGQYPGAPYYQQQYDNHSGSSGAWSGQGGQN